MQPKVVLNIKTNRSIVTMGAITPLQEYARLRISGCTLHRHVNCGNPLFSVCVPTPDINYHRNVKVVFEVLISDFFTLRSEHEMLRKVPKIKDFYEVFFCINTIVSTCPVPGNISTGRPLILPYPSPANCRRSLASGAGSQET